MLLVNKTTPVLYPIGSYFHRSSPVLATPWNPATAFISYALTPSPGLITMGYLLYFRCQFPEISALLRPSCGCDRVRNFRFSCGVRDSVGVGWRDSIHSHQANTWAPVLYLALCLVLWSGGEGRLGCGPHRGRTSKKERHGGLMEPLQGVAGLDSFNWGTGPRGTRPLNGVFKLYGVCQTDRDASGKDI